MSRERKAMDDEVQNM